MNVQKVSRCFVLFLNVFKLKEYVNTSALNRRGAQTRKRGRGLAWTKIRARGARGPGFKSPRPHQNAYFDS